MAALIKRASAADKLLVRDHTELAVRGSNLAVWPFGCFCFLLVGLRLASPKPILYKLTAEAQIGAKMIRSLHFQPLSVPGQAQPRKEPNDQIFTFQAWVAIFALRHMNNLSAAGQAQKGAKWPDLYILSLGGHVCIAPYEQFISGWPSPERSHMARSLHSELGWPCVRRTI